MVQANSEKNARAQMTYEERRDLFQRVLLRDQVSLLVLDEWLRMCHYYDIITSEEERVQHNLAVELMATLGLQREESTLLNLQSMVATARKLQAAEGSK